MRQKEKDHRWQAAANRGRSVNQTELREFVEKETEKLRDNLDHMIEDYESSKAARKITEADKTRLSSCITK